MADWLKFILSAILTSAGFWAFATKVLDKKSAKSRMILGLGYLALTNACMEYIKRGNITQNEYEDLRKYLYDPYKAMGGDGSAERLMRAVDSLPIIPNN